MPIRFDLKDEPEVKKQQIKWSKMIERNSEEIRRLIEVEIPKTQEEYGIERGEFEASIKSKADIEEITRLRATYDDIDANVNSKPVAISRAKALGIDVNPSSHTKTIKNKILKELERQIKDLEKTPKAGKALTAEEIEQKFQDKMEKIQAEIELLKGENTRLESLINEADRTIETTKENIRNNRIEEERISRLNKDKLDEFAGQLTALNSGMMDLTRRDDETDEEYRQRLITNGQTVYDDKIAEDDENAIQLARAKNNLNKVVSDEGKISTIANKLTADDRYQYNKIAPTINKK